MGWKEITSDIWKSKPNGRNKFVNKDDIKKYLKDKHERINRAIALYMLADKMTIVRACQMTGATVSSVKSRLYDTRYKTIYPAAVGMDMYSDIRERTKDKKLGEELRKNAIAFFLQKDFKKKLNELKKESNS